MVSKYRWDDFVLDLDAYSLERAGVPLALEPKAFNVLALVIQRPGHVFTKQEIFDAVWPDTIVSDHALTRVIAQLRRVLGDEAREPRYIETVPTRGYRWLLPVESGAAPAPAPPVRATTTTAAAALSDTTTSARAFPALAAGFVAAVVLLAVLAWSQGATRTSATAAPSGEPAWPVQLTTNAGLDLHPALSPQGDAVAYASDRSGALEIYVRALLGTATESALTRNGGHNVQPAWSPDGRLIAFHSARDGGIWVLPARGGVAKQIVPSGSDPAWSPDGRRIAFKSDEHADVTPSAFGAQSGSTLWVVDADGSNLRQLTEPGRPLGGHASPVWSSDSRYLAFSVFEGGVNNGVWLLALDTRETTLLEGGRGLYELAFAPNDSALYAAGGEPLIIRLPFDSRTGKRTTRRELIPVPGVASVRGLTVSSDGRRIAFAGLALSSQIWAQPVGRDGSARADAHAVTADTSRRNSLPVVSPDGSKIAYVSTRGGEPPNIWVMDLDGGNAMQVTSDESADMQPFWFPDGRRVAFSSNRQNRRGIWTVDLATRREERLSGMLAKRQQPLDGFGTIGEFALSPSMTRAAFSVIRSPAARRAIYLTSVSEFAPRQVTDSSQWVGYPAWSPDERYLAVEIKDGSDTHAGVLDLQHGAVRRLTNERGQTWVRSWSPDGRKIAAAAFRNGVWDLRWIDATTGNEGTITPATRPNVYMRYPEWSARGDMVVFERGELRGNIWTLALDRSPQDTSKR